MANWKRLTLTDGPSVDVNIDYVSHMRAGKGGTTVFFVCSKNDDGKTMWVDVTETPDQIHKATLVF
jgi:hypothetical protein